MKLKLVPESVASLHHIAQALDSTAVRKMPVEPLGATQIFKFQCKTNILHSALRLKSQIQVVTKKLLMGVLVASLSQSLLAAGLTASVNADKVGLGEAFELSIISQKEDVKSLDLAPLYQTFELLGSSQSVQTQIVNGQRSSQKSWVITLAPKALGEVTIPQINAGQYSSDPLTIEVVEAAKLPKSVGVDGVSVEVTITPQGSGPFYPFQEIPIKVRIETNQTMQQAELIVPKSDDMQLTQVGQDKVSHVVRNAQRFKVIEREYLLKPQTSGALTLAPFVLRGKVAKQSGQSRADTFMPNHLAMLRHLGFGAGFAEIESAFAGRGSQAFQVRSEPLTMTVAQAPGTSNTQQGIDQGGWFLPAKAVQIEGQWQSDIKAVKVGDSLVKKFVVTALGASQEQLPALNFTASDNVKIYVDDIHTEQVQTAQGTVARSETTISIVPTKTGEITLPAVEIPWMNTLTNTAEVAVLAEQRLNVSAAINSRTGTTASEEPQNNQVPADSSKNNEQGGAKNNGLIKQLESLFFGTSENALSGLSWVTLLSSLAVLLLGVILFKWRKHSSIKRADKREVDRTDSLNNLDSTGPIKVKSMLKNDSQHRAALSQALQSNDKLKIYRCLITWLRLNNDDRLNQQLKPQVQLLEQALFNSTEDTSSVDTSALKKQLSKILESQYRTHLNNQKQLPGLYPSH